MELWTGALSWWKCHWPDLKSAGLFRRNLFLNSLNIVFLVDCLSSGNPVYVDHASAVKKKGSSKVCGCICSVWPSWVWESQHAFTGNYIFSEHPWDKLRANLQFLANNCVYSSHSDIKLCTYCLYRHTTVLIHENLTSLLLPHLSSSLTDSLPSLNLLCHSKTHARFMQDAPKAVWSIPYVSVVFFPCLKQNFIAYRSSNVSSRPDCIFEIHQLWQSGFSRVYSNCCCSCWFEPEIIKIGQSSHNMYSNNTLSLRQF